MVSGEGAGYIENIADLVCRRFAAPHMSTEAESLLKLLEELLATGYRVLVARFVAKVLTRASTDEAVHKLLHRLSAWLPVALLLPSITDEYDPPLPATCSRSAQKMPSNLACYFFRLAAALSGAQLGWLLANIILLVKESLPTIGIADVGAYAYILYDVAKRIPPSLILPPSQEVIFLDLSTVPHVAFPPALTTALWRGRWTFRRMAAHLLRLRRTMPKRLEQNKRRPRSTD